MDREHLCESLIIWLQTFKLDAGSSTVDELTDGVAMAQVLHQIAPAFFDDAWMSKIKLEASKNWRLKVSNLKKVLKGILDYYAQVLGQQIQDFHMPDVNAIGETNDSAELGRLLQLILGCAVNCDEKHEYIQRIMAMEESVQHVVMNAIQELMTKERPASVGEAGYSELGEQLKRTVEELNSVVEAKEEISKRCHELDAQVATLQEEKANLEAENERLNERINQADSLEDPSTLAGRRFQQLQNQVEQLQDDLYRLETAKEDYRIKVEAQEKEILELQQKNEELTSLAEEARTLKDELDILRDTSYKVAKYEQTIETYKKKLEEMGDLKRQMKLVEDKNTSYMQTNMELEEEVRKGQTFKSQLEMYKKQVQELQSKSTEETKRADKAEFETKRVQEKMAAVQREKERLIAERDSLKETNEELRCTQVQDNLLGEAEGGALGGGSMLDMVSVPAEVKERIIRLQHENKMLKLAREASEDKEGQLLQAMLDDANARKNELESEIRIANQRTMELEAQVEDLQENQKKKADDSGSEARKQLKEQMQRNSDYDTELQKKSSQIEGLEAKVLSVTEKNAELQELLSKKEDEMRAMEDRYKRYLEKAKSVIKTLDPKLNPGTASEVQALRNQLQEKDRLVEHLERDREKTKVIREQEEKLMVTAWYNLGMQLHRKAAEDRLANSTQGQSFLARQRQAHTRRTQSMASPHSHAGASR